MWDIVSYLEVIKSRFKCPTTSLGDSGADCCSDNYYFFNMSLEKIYPAPEDGLFLPQKLIYSMYKTQ